MTLIPTRYIKSLTKRLIIQLPGMQQYRNNTLPQLKATLTTKLTELGINRRGIKVRDYISAYNQRERETDNNLFASISRDKQSRKQTQQQRQEYRQHLRETAMEERSIMNINPYYQDTKTLERKYFEQNVTNKKKFTQVMKTMMSDAKNHIGCTVDIGDDSEKLYAFTKLLHHLHQTHKSTDRIRPVIFGEDLNGTQKIFTVNNNTDINLLVNNMLDGIDIGSTFSDSPVEVIGDTFIPDKFTIVYVEKKTTKTNKSRSSSKFTGRLRNPVTNKIEQQEFR